MQDPVTKEIDDDEENEIDLARNILDEDNEDDDEPEPEPEDNDEDEDDEPDVQIQVKRKKRKKRKMEKSARDPRELEEVNDIIEALAPGSTTGIHVKLMRVEPKIFKGHKIGGYVTRIDESFDIDDIKKRFGGGTYDLVFYGPKEYRKGMPYGTKIIRRKRIEVAGNPYLNEDDDGHGNAKKTQDLDMVQTVLGAQKQMIDKERESSRESDKRNQDLISVLLSGNKNDGISDLLKLQSEQSRMAIESQKEENRLLREESARREERLANEMREIKKESMGQLGPIIALMQSQSEKDSNNTKMMMQQMLTMFAALSDSGKQSMQNTIQMMQDTSKMQIDLLLGELKRSSEEAKELRVNSRSDLTSELQKLKAIKELAGSISDESKESSGGIGGKIVEALPGIIESIPGLMALFTPGAPIPQAPIRALPSRAGPGKLIQPDETELEIEEEEEEIPKPTNEQEKIGIAIARLKIQTEEAIGNGVDPDKFVEEKILKEFDNDVLVQIASVPFQLVITTIEQSFPDDNESSLFTVKGKDYLRKMHTTLKSKLL